MTKKTVVLVLVSILALTAVVLAGCASPAPSPPQSPKPATTSAPASASSPAPAVAPQPAAKKIVLSMAGTVPDSDIKTIAARQFAETVKKQTNGEVEIQVFPNGQLIQDKDMPNGVPAGMADLAQCQISSFSGLIPEANLLDMCMYYSSAEHRWAVVDGKVGDIIAQKLQAKANIKFLTWVSQCATDSWLCTTKTIKEPQDLKGLKYRTPPTPVYAKTVDALGAAGTIIGATELYTALQTGTVAGTMCTARALVEYKWYEVAPYISRMITTPDASQAFIANLDSWNKIPANYQQIILKAAQEQKKWTIESATKDNESYWNKVAEFKQKGIVKDFYVIPADTVKKFIDIVAPAQKEIIMKNQNITNAKELLDYVEQVRPK